MEIHSQIKTILFTQKNSNLIDVTQINVGSYPSVVNLIYNILDREIQSHVPIFLN